MEELGGFDAAPQQQPGREVVPDQLPLSPEELLLAVSRIKQERADTPPAELRGAVGGAAEDLRCVLIRTSRVRVHFLSQVKPESPSVLAARVTLELASRLAFPLCPKRRWSQKDLTRLFIYLQSLIKSEVRLQPRPFPASEAPPQ